VIHAMHHEQDMRNYGGLRKKIPYTFAAMLIGTLAITGVGIPLTHYGFAGFLSKDAVIESAYGGGSQYAFWMLVIAAFMTSFYSWRLMFMTFFGTPRGDHHTHDHAHESPVVMLVPLGVLALGAMFSGMIWYNVFFGKEEALRPWFGMEAAMAHEGAEGAERATEEQATGEAAVATAETQTEGDVAATEGAGDETVVATGPIGISGSAPKGAIYLGADNHVIHAAHEAPEWVKAAPFVAMILGLMLAFQFYILRPDLPGRLARQQAPLYRFLLNKWYFDEIYDAIFVQPARWLGGFLWKRGDGNVIDGSINGVALGIIPFFTRLAGRAQSGYIFHYAFAMFLGIGALITWVTLGGGAQ
jgi:NADH-quinone oxidoreductase subunit L